MTKFHIDSDYVQKYPVQVVGSLVHEQLWVPVEELDQFNVHIIGLIEVEAEFR